MTPVPRRVERKPNDDDGRYSADAEVRKSRNPPRWPDWARLDSCAARGCVAPSVQVSYP